MISAKWFTRRATLILGGGIIILRIARSFIGVDLTDEAQYLGQAYGLFLTGHPLRVDLLIQQLASLPVASMLPIFLRVTGNTDYLVLVGRLLHLLISGAMSIWLYTVLRGAFSKSGAIWGSLLFFVFIPFSIPQVSYNSLGAQLFALAVVKFAVASPTSRSLVITGILLGTSAIALPSVGLGVMLLLLSIPLEKGTPICQRLARVFSCAAGIFIGISVPVILLVYGGLDGKVAPLYDSLLLSKKISEVSLLQRFTTSFLELTPLWCSVAAAYLLCGILARKGPRATPIVAYGLITTLVIATILQSAPSPLWQLNAAVVTALSGITIFYSLISPTHVRFGAALAINVASAFGIASTSGNGVMNFGIGFLAAATLAVAAGLSSIRFTKVIGSINAALVLFSLFSLLRFTYRDSGLSGQLRMVSSGPYRGLMTTPERSNLIEDLTRAIRYQEPSEGPCSLLTIDSIAAPYLISRCVPTPPQLLLPCAHCYGPDRSYYIDYMSRYSIAPDIVIFTEIKQLNLYPVPWDTDPKTDELRAWVMSQQHYETCVSGKGWTLLATRCRPLPPK